MIRVATGVVSWGLTQLRNSLDNITGKKKGEAQEPMMGVLVHYPGIGLLPLPLLLLLLILIQTPLLGREQGMV